MAYALATQTTNTSDIISFIIHQGNGVKGLSDIGLKTLPKQYIHPLEETIFTAETTSQESIPIIDMSNFDDPKVSESICDAAEKWGFFQVVNHGVPLQVLENIKLATHRFFELSAEEKNKYSKEQSASRNVRFGTSFRPETEKVLEWKDYLSLAYTNEDEASAMWPPICKNQVLEYMKRSESLIKHLLQALLKRLNLNEITDKEQSLLMGSVRINMNYYPVCPNPELTVGVGRHSDVSTLTILLQDEVGGLYVRSSQDNSWIPVPPLEGSLVINVGDALQIMSNGLYRSVEHRVVANISRNRISVPMFVNPSPSAVIGPLSEVLANGEKALYKEVLYSEYVKHFFRKPHDGKKTIEYAEI